MYKRYYDTILLLLSVLRRFLYSDYPFGIIRLFLQNSIAMYGSVCSFVGVTTTTFGGLYSIQPPSWVIIQFLIWITRRVSAVSGVYMVGNGFVLVNFLCSQFSVSCIVDNRLSLSSLSFCPCIVYPSSYFCLPLWFPQSVYKVSIFGY